MDYLTVRFSMIGIFMDNHDPHQAIDDAFDYPSSASRIFTLKNASTCVGNTIINRTRVRLLIVQLYDY